MESEIPNETMTKLKFRTREIGQLREMVKLRTW